MRRVHKVITAVFLGGVLLGGVGTGIALVEYSSLAYGGEHLIGEEYLVTKSLDYEFAQDGRILILPGRYDMGIMRAPLIETDDTVPVGIVRYEVTYNEKRLVPQLIFEPWEEEEILEEEEVSEEEVPEEEVSEEGGAPGEEEIPEEEGVPKEEEASGGEDSKEQGGPVYAGRLYLTTFWRGSGFEVFMENKDRFLEELKEKKISTYREAHITGIKVKVNSGTRPFVEARER